MVESPRRRIPIFFWNSVERHGPASTECQSLELDMHVRAGGPWRWLRTTRRLSRCKPTHGKLIRTSVQLPLCLQPSPRHINDGMPSRVSRVLEWMNYPYSDHDVCGSLGRNRVQDIRHSRLGMAVLLLCCNCNRRQPRRRSGLRRQGPFALCRLLWFAMCPGTSCTVVCGPTQDGWRCSTPTR